LEHGPDGELHLTILIENMRREGYELAVSKPRVVFHHEGDTRLEPIEFVTADVEDQHQGAVMQALGERRADLVNMAPDGMGRVRLDYKIPARGLIGFQNEFLNLTRGTGLISNIFDSYEPYKGEIEGRKNGVLISQDDGEAVTYSLGKLDDRVVAHGAIPDEGFEDVCVLSGPHEQNEMLGRCVLVRCESVNRPRRDVVKRCLRKSRGFFVLDLREIREHRDEVFLRQREESARKREQHLVRIRAGAELSDHLCRTQFAGCRTHFSVSR